MIATAAICWPLPPSSGLLRVLSRPRVAGRPFYGWVVVGAAFVVLFLGFGTIYAFAAFAGALETEFHASRPALSLVFAITSFLALSLGALSGPVADHVGPRPVVVCGTAVTGLGLLLSACTDTLWQVYLTYSLGVGAGVGLVYVPAVSAVQHWFVRRRGLASGIAAAGIGVGTLVMAPSAAVLVQLAGWRGAYTVLAVLVLSAGIGAALLVDGSPERRGLRPDGDGRDEGPSGQPAGLPAGTMASSATPLAVLPGMTTRQALRTRAFWLLYAAGTVGWLGLFVPLAHLAPAARDHGLPAETGPMLVGLVGAGSLAGRLLGGVADRIGRRRMLLACFVGATGLLVGWEWATGLAALAVFAVLFGLGYGTCVAVVPTLATDYFGVRHTGGINGMLATGRGIGTLVGPALAGALHHLYGSYGLPILLAAGAVLVGALCLALLPDPAPRRFSNLP